MRVLLINFLNRVLHLIRLIQSIKLPHIPLTGLQWVLLLFLLLGGLYALATPPFETLDEAEHFHRAETLLESGALRPDEPPQGLLAPVVRPPLYYGIAALLLTPFDRSDAPDWRRANPHVAAWQLSALDNHNLFLHDDERALQGAGLAVMALRVLGLMLGLVTIWSVHAAARLALPRRPAAATTAAALLAFNPMFLLTSASASSLALAMALNGLALYLLFYLLRRSLTLRVTLLLAFVLGLAALTDPSGAVLALIAAAALLWAGRGRQRPRDGLLAAGLVLLAMVLMAGWWYAGNMTAYGDVLGRIAQPPVEDAAPSLLQVIDSLQIFRLSYWGLFGALNLMASPLLYLVADFITMLALFGGLFLLAQLASLRDYGYARRELGGLGWLLLIALAGAALMSLWSAPSAALAYGLFPFIAATSILLGAGLVELVWWLLFMLRPPMDWHVILPEIVPQERLQAALRWLPGLLLLSALLVPLTTLPRAYTPPAPVPNLPETAVQVYARYGPLALIGYETAYHRYAPGQELSVTLYWQALENPADNYSLSLALLAGPRIEVSKLDTYPGGGLLRTSGWQAGEIYADHFTLTISPALRAGRFPLYLSVNWFDSVSGQRFSPTDESGQPISPVLLSAGALAAGGWQPSLDSFTQVEEEADFGGLFRLRGYRLEEGLLTLMWEARDNIAQDYTVAVHVLDENGVLLTQSDAPPSFPTRYWRWGDLFSTQHRLDPDAAAGGMVHVGWYSHTAGEPERLEGPQESGLYALPAALLAEPEATPEPAETPESG